MKPSPKKIIAAVCVEFEISEKNLRKKSNRRSAVYPQQIAAYLLHADGGAAIGDKPLSLRVIGTFLGPYSSSGADQRKHGTIIRWIGEVESMLADPERVAEVSRHIKNIRSRYMSPDIVSANDLNYRATFCNALLPIASGSTFAWYTTIGQGGHRSR